MLRRSLLVCCLVALLAAACVSVAQAADSEMQVDEQVMLPGYREQIAEQLRYLSQASYCSVDSVSSWTCPLCKQGSLANFKLTHKFFDANTNTFGFAGLAPAAGENVILFSFRGATPSAGRNWITDLNSQRMPYPGLRGATVHKGFYHNYLTIARQVNLAAKSLLANCQHCHIYVTGHSLGGAIATLAAADLYAITPDLTLYTFGAPRVGDEKFAAHFDRIVPDTYRLVNAHDLVPHLPQRFLGFRHVSREIWYYGGKQGAYKQCAGGEDDACSNSVNLHVDENSIQDHATYLSQPMGCRPADLHRQGLISMIEQSVDITASSSPMHKLRSTVATPASGSAALASDEELLAFEEKGINLLEIRAGTDALQAALPPMPTSLAHLENDLTEETPSLLEVSSLPNAAQNLLDDALEAEADRKAAAFALSGGKDVSPARVLQPLKRPDLNQLHAKFYQVQQDWTRLPVSWNPAIKQETEEEKWNREFPEPK